MKPAVVWIGVALLIGVTVGFFTHTWMVTRVVSVPDGDSLKLANGLRVRLLGLDAPERGRCMADKAHDYLTVLTLGKHVRLADTVTDGYGRTLANVTAGGRFVNAYMVRAGLAKYRFTTSSREKEMETSYKHAQNEKLGIFSEQCRTSVSQNGCTIKGNLKNGKKIYHMPTCPNYSQVIVDESYGDTWFCTESEAGNAGFAKADGCP